MTTPRSHADYLKVARELEKSNCKPYSRFAILASFTADFLAPYIMVASEQIGHLLRPWFGPFNQFEQMVLDSTTTLWQQKPDALWISIRVEDFDPDLARNLPQMAPVAVETRLDELRGRLVLLARGARRAFNGPILVSNLTVQLHMKSNLFDASNPDGLQHLVSRHNHLLAKELSQLSDVHVFDYAGCISLCGHSNWQDDRLWYKARIPIGPAAQKEFAGILVRALLALLRTPAKCIALDLDNTLWGGIVGEDGRGGIKLGHDYPGNVFRDFQHALLGYRNRGFLLAVVSKNDSDLVNDVLDLHPEMVLRRHHLAAIQANWEPKAENLRRLAATLNIGLESIVFVDDNPVERAHVRAELPMVQVVDLPSSPLGFVEALQNVAVLDHPRLSAEDCNRAEMYKQEVGRKELKLEHTDPHDFLAELEMVAQVGLADNYTLDRCLQLIQKTNQFNLTTRRYSLADLTSLCKGKDSEVAWLRLSDRFGDMGLVCVGVLKRASYEVWEVDTFLLSCRAMGRSVEDAFLAYMAHLAREKGATILRGTYVPTRRNRPAATFYEDRKFIEVSQPYEDFRTYEISLVADLINWPAHIEKTKVLVDVDYG